MYISLTLAAKLSFTALKAALLQKAGVALLQIVGVCWTFELGLLIDCLILTAPGRVAADALLCTRTREDDEWLDELEFTLVLFVILWGASLLIVRLKRSRNDNEDDER